MCRKLLTIALLCLLCQTANAQYYATVDELIRANNTGMIEGTMTPIVHVKNFGVDRGDGKQYDYIYILYAYFSSGGTVSQRNYFAALEKSSLGYRVVGSCPVIHPPNQSVITITPRPPNRTLLHQNRYVFTYYQIREYYININNAKDNFPTTREQYIAKYGDLPPEYTKFTKFSGVVPLGDLTRDTDGGGVPDYAEYTCGYWTTNINDASDDFFCFCNPCCACRCTCRFYCSKFCDGSTDPTTGCTCHDGSWVDPTDPTDPPDPPDPQPGLSENAPALLRGMLFMICMFCGAGFFGSFMDSFEKGSF